MKEEGKRASSGAGRTASVDEAAAESIFMVKLATTAWRLRGSPVAY